MVSGGTVGASHSDMDDTILDFLQSKVNSFIKWDLIRFFHDNPHTKDTAEKLANYTGRDVRTVERELQELADVQVIVTDTVSKVVVYSLSQDQSVRSIIDRFMEACHDRQFRVAAIHHVIRGMQVSSH